MPASGLVLVLRPDPTGRSALALRSALAARPEITLGPWSGDPTRGSHLALVTETANRAADQDLWDWLHARPEVLSVALAFAHFDEPQTESAAATDFASRRLS